jgi:hypothetical protein
MIRIPTAICLMALGVAACDSDNIDGITSNPGIAIVDDQTTDDADSGTDAEVEMNEPEMVEPVDNSTDTSEEQQTTNDPVNNAPSMDDGDDDSGDDSGGSDTDAAGGQANDSDEGESTQQNAGSDADSNDATDGAGDDAPTDTADEPAEDTAGNDGEAATGDEAQDTDNDAQESGNDAQETGNDAQENEADVQPDDSSGSATSDGGEVADNGGNQPVIDPDAGSSTSDGGEVADDDGLLAADASSPEPTQPDNGDSSPNGGEFQSDSTGGSVIRSSSLGSVAQVEICTTASNQQNFSDTRVGDFILHNNAWRPFRAFPGYEWEQCIYTNTNGALAGWSYDWGPGQGGLNGNPRPSGDFYVRSYPELIFGVKDEFRTSAPQSVTGLPVELSQMPNIAIDYSYNGPQYGEARTVDASNNPRFPNGATISGERNIAIESFLYNKDASGQCSEGIVSRNGGSNHTYEIMVWLDAGAERLPAGPSDFVTDLTIRGAPYKVYTKGSDPRYIAFVAQNPQNSGTIYWNDYVDWARANAHRVQELFGARSNSVPIQDDWCVANILVGTEIFWGAGNLDLYNWTITQSQ